MKDDKSFIIKKYFPLLVLALIFLFVIPLISIDIKLIVQSTLNYFIKDPPNLFNDFFAWNSTNFGNNSFSSMWRLFPLNIIYLICNILIGIPPNITQFIVLLSLFLTGIISFCVLIKELFNFQKINETAILIGSLFFICNLYVISLLPGSYFMIIPYIFLPLQLYLFIKGARSNQLLKYGIFLGFTNSLVFGVNLVFDAIAIFLLLSYGLWSVFIIKEIKFKKFISFSTLMGVFTSLFIVWWIAPMLYGNIIDKTTTQYNLGSETFYNNDTSVTNIFRNLGDWAFFGGYRGIPYHNFSPIYKTNPIVILSTFVMPIIILLPLLFSEIKNRKYKKKILFFYIIIILLFPFIGGTYSGWPTHNLVQWLFDNVPYFAILRNTYKWTSITVFFYAVLIVVFLNHILSLKNKKNGKLIPLLKKGVLISTFVFILINAFPFLTGKLFEEGKQFDKIPEYWHQTANYVNSKFDLTENRILLLPDQYFEVFKWDEQMQFVQGGLANALFTIPEVHNTCVGCGNYNASQLYSFIYNNLKTPDLDKLLGMVNISHILQRNDYYSEYYNVEKPKKVKEIISLYHSISPLETFGMLDFYQLDKNLVYSRIYSPSKIAITDTFGESLGIFDQFKSDDKKLSFLLSSQINFNDKLTLKYLNYYKKLFKKENTKFENNTAFEDFEVLPADTYKISKDEKLAFNSYKIYYLYNNKNLILKFKNIDEMVSVGNEQVNYNVVNNFEKEIIFNIQILEKIGVEIEDEVFYLEPTEEWRYLDNIQLKQKDSYSINVYDIDKENNDNLIGNGSFENGYWQEKVGNCNLHNPNANILMDLVENTSDGKLALLLSAEEDSACTQSGVIKGFEPNTVYFLSFDHKNIAGSPPSFCIWDGSGCAIYSDVPVSENWQTYETLIKLNSKAKQFILYLYSHKSRDSITINLYDNIKIYKIVEPIKKINFELPYTPKFSKDIFLESGQHRITANVLKNENNLLENNSFENGLWNEKVENCRLANSKARLGMKLSDDSMEGKNSLELSAKEDVACASSAPIIKFSKYKTYAVSFDYKIVDGEIARFCAWDGTACVKIEDIEKIDNEWHHYEGIFEPNVDSRFLNIYFYASAEKVKNAVVKYDNVKINEVENKILDTYNLKTKDEKIINAANVVFEKVDPTYYKLDVKQEGSALIIFQESFHPGWRAYVQKEKSPNSLWDNIKRYLGIWDEKEISQNQHIIANGFANAWWINLSDLDGKNNYEIILEFWPQRLFYFGAIISITTLIFCLLYLGWDWKKQKIKTETVHITIVK